MKEVSPALKSWVELLEKSLLIISTSIVILTAAYQGSDFLNSKTEQADAQKIEIKQRTAALDLMTSTYTTLLSKLDSEIQALDEKMGSEVWKNSVGWEKYSAIRQQKVNDRNALLRSLGNQVVQLKEAEN